MHKGVIPLIALIIGFIVAILVALGWNDNPLVKLLPTPTPEVTLALPPTPTPTAIPTPTAKPSPKPTPTIKPSPVPTSTPIAPAVSGPPGTGLSTITVATELGNFRATVLSLDMGSTRMITETGNDGDCGSGCVTLPLATYVSRNGGFAGVNGTYFCPAAYPECSGKTDSFDFPVYNTRLGHWINSNTLGWNGRAIFYTDGSGAHYQQNSAGFGGGLNAGIINYPGLVDGGNVQIDSNQSGLSDKQKGVGTKVGIGTRNPSNVMVVIAYSVNMQQFAYVFKALGATGALNLDDGGSTALYYQGRYVAGPGRNLPNSVVFAPK
ncbi:MAG: phosphodiester glycosidase family protein [bacterium]|nr:phosphodiester glycosidase family protein [bacterium]